MTTNHTPDAGNTSESNTNSVDGAAVPPSSPFAGESFPGRQDAAQSGYPGAQPGDAQQPGSQQGAYQQPGAQQPGYQQGAYQQAGAQQGGYQQAGYPQQGAASGIDDRTGALISHLSAPVAALISAGWLSIAGPLVMWLIFKDKSPFIRVASAESFNFQITTWIASIVGWILCFTIILLPIGLLLILLAGLASIVFGIIGAVKVANGEQYRYPWNLKLLK